ncbi:enoyl-CoA hydratase/isomerase family protein [Ramlibacter alkalitolerans]|uniref:Enoyl-CoA hydratase/isomerase family protein n=1 Tax=Ramlibacter alkalitolerans TaxID=2039631 RepID=A0ABS1JM27_9BURK|nr:enoyl-CoA hydratase/isomerase family protein [Ramlibacter alkalitolerans]MBL0425290.1 enoyl-CoA hydratase/isomerase family protein [Ramlibacter alkalitolerans]
MSVIQIERHGATAVLTLNRPQARNALDPALREALGEAVAEVRDDPAVRAVVLTGAGGHFCAGGDVKAISEGGQGQRDIYEGRERIRRIHRWLDELVDLEKPVIAAVDGVAFGAGLSVALAADFVIASPRAKFCAVFARLGFVPDMGAMYLLPRAIGLARAKDLVFSARVVEAQEALDIGLVQQVCTGDVLQSALEFAQRFAHAPTEAIGLAKGVMNHAFESERRTVYVQEAMGQAMARESAFHQEAVRRFLAKEAPLYQWPEQKTRST